MTRAYFDTVAPAWETMRQQFFPESLKERVADALPVRPGARVLDVGAGSGFLTGALLARGARVTALDASPGMVDELRGRFPGVDARAGDAEALPFANGAFDGVVANMCLHHVERPALALREMARVLAPGGRLALADLDAHDIEFLRVEHHDRWMGFARADVEGWLREAGLEDVRIGSVGSDCCATSACGTQRAEVSIFLATGRKPVQVAERQLDV